MVIINCGIQKSGTTLIFQYQLSIQQLSGKRNAQKVFNSKSIGGFVNKINFRIFVFILFVRIFYGSFVVKIHHIPNIYIRLLVFFGIAKVTFCLRDPRDTSLSMFDHANKIRQGLSKPNGFENIHSLEQSVNVIKNSILWHNWLKYGNAIFIKFEHLNNDKFYFLKYITYYCKIYNLSDEVLREIVTKYDKKSHNLNKAESYRYKNELDKNKLEWINKELKEQILEMGYKLE